MLIINQILKENKKLSKKHKKLLEELNSYGFEFKETDLGLDKLRTLYYGKKMYSLNQGFPALSDQSIYLRKQKKYKVFQQSLCSASY